MGRIVRGVVVGALGAGLMIGGWNAGKEELGAAAADYGYAADGINDGFDKVHALGTGVGQYGKLALFNVCDKYPVWTPCDRRPNKINTNDHFVNAVGPEIFTLGGLVAGAFGVWSVIGGIIGASKERYNRGSRAAGNTAITDATY